MKNISIIVAVAENWAIGKNNQLLFSLSDDLKRFKKITTGHTVVMGKKTFFSLPKGALPNRKNIVISDDRKDKFTGCEMAYSIEEAIEKCDPDEENFIIGGGMIYKQFFPVTNKLYLTQIHQSVEGADIFFPEINFDEWELLGKEDIEANENHPPYSNLIYKKSNK